MNCGNCGAAMDLLGARRYYFCHHCGSFHFPEPQEKGLRVLGPAANPLSCAVCRSPLTKALIDEEHVVEYCEKCRGLLLQRAYFAEVVTRRRAWATSPVVQPEPLDPRELERRVKCPACSQRMVTHPYYGPGNVVVETCDACDLIWLDYGELQRIVDAPGRDRGNRQPVSTFYDPRPAPAKEDEEAPPDPLRMLFDLLT